VVEEEDHILLLLVLVDQVAVVMVVLMVPQVLMLHFPLDLVEVVQVHQHHLDLLEVMVPLVL
tara:strand:- start:23 stop:208 length:186 start_codon:yes stop_codon:yes gene_type:complete